MSADVKALGSSYKEYKKDYRLLIKFAKLDDQEYKNVKTLNRAIVEFYGLTSSQQKKEEQVKIRRKLKELRNLRVKFIDTILLKKYGKEKWQQVKDAEDLYLYIHTLLGAMDPYRYLNLRYDKKPINQIDYIDILKTFPVDTALDQSPVKEVFQIAFNFTANELIDFFNNKLHENTIREGDLIFMSNSAHAFFLIYRQGIFELYDPLLVKKDSSIKTLVVELQQTLFQKKEYMPIEMIIYQRKGFNLQVERPMRLDIIKKLVSERPVDQKNIDKFIWLSAKLGHNDTIKYLVEQKADIHVKHSIGSNAVWIAVMNGRIETVRLLAELKADLNAENQAFLPLSLSIAMGDFAMMKALADLKADIHAKNIFNEFPIFEVARKGHVKALKWLIEKKAELNIPNSKGITPYLVALTLGHAEFIKVLMEEKVVVDINEAIEGLPPVLWAIKYRQTKVIKVLAELKVDINEKDKNGWTPSMLAAHDGFSKVVKVLANCKANLDVDNMGITAAILAAKKGDGKTLLTLFEMKVDLNKEYKTGTSPLLIATTTGGVKLLKDLIKAKVDIQSANQEGVTLAFLAVKKQDIKALEILVECKAELNVRNKNGWTAAMLAAQLGLVKSLKSLAKLGANLTADNKGWTPGLLAAKEGHLEILKLLAECKVDLTKSIAGRTPLSVARAQNHEDIVFFLQDMQKNHHKKNFSSRH
jgi:serine/threonine-protein phosphatase 6 regulatory ankyrin repeat subunit B